MKPLTLLTTIFTLITSLAAATSVDVVNSYRVGGSFHKASASLHEHNPEAFNEATSVGNCAETLTILKNTDKPTIAIWDLLGPALSENDSCKIDESMFITTYVSAYYNFCSIKDEYNLEYLLNNKAKVGVADWYTIKEAASKTLEGIGSTSRIIAYSTSKDYLLALEIGEIEYVYTSSPAKNMNCVLSNDPRSSAAYTGDLYDHPFANFSSDIAIIGVNVDKDEIQELIIDSSTNSEWAKTFSYYKNDFGKLFRNEQLRVFKRLLATFR